MTKVRGGPSPRRGQRWGTARRTCAITIVTLAMVLASPSQGAWPACIRALVETLPAPRLALARNREVVVEVAPPGGRSAWMNGAVKLLFPALGVTEFARIYRRVRNGDPNIPGTTRLLDALRIRVAMNEEALEGIPRTGPLVVVANHPRFGIDGLAIADVLGRIRPDVKVMMNAFMTGLPEVAAQAIGVGDSREAKVKALRESTEWLENGGALVIFPAGAVSVELEDFRYVDPDWQMGAARLAQRTKSAVLPVFVDGGPSAFYHQMRFLYPPITYPLMLREFLAQQGNTVNLRLRRVFEPERVTSVTGDILLKQLRSAVYDGDEEETR